MKKKESNILCFTWLSGGGKTTLANQTYKNLNKYNFKLLKIDGDIFRKKTKNKNNFTKKNIIFNNNRIILYVKRLEKKFDFIIISVISPLLVTRKKARKIFKHRYIEIYTKCGLKELIKRDTKGLYKKARNKLVNNLIGFNSKIKYEKSNYKKIIVDTKKYNISKCTNLILKKIP